MFVDRRKLKYKELSDQLDALMNPDTEGEKPTWVAQIEVDLQRTFSKWLADTTGGRKRALYDVAIARAKDGDEVRPQAIDRFL